MTGEVGTGKTLLLRCLLHLFDRAHINYAYVFNPRLCPLELLQYIADDFHLPAAGKHKGELLVLLLRFLAQSHRNKMTTVLMLDEAHDLSDDVLEEIRLLSNLETNTDKLVQILLVGQPELDAKLDSFKLRQVKQRIAVRAQLKPLDFCETNGYILRRLELAGGNSHSEPLFPYATVAAVHRYSEGIPRLINALCENALDKAFARKAKSVAPEIIQEVAVDLRLNLQHKDESWHVAGDNKVLEAAKTLLRLHEHLLSVKHRPGPVTGAALTSMSEQSMQKVASPRTAAE